MPRTTKALYAINLSFHGILFPVRLTATWKHTSVLRLRTVRFAQASLFYCFENTGPRIDQKNLYCLDISRQNSRRELQTLEFSRACDVIFINRISLLAPVLQFGDEGFRNANYSPEFLHKELEWQAKLMVAIKSFQLFCGHKSIEVAQYRGPAGGAV